jgi:hypothetical protein
MATNRSPLHAWLDAKLRSQSVLRFLVTDLSERCEVNAEIVHYLGLLVRKAKSDSELLRRMTDVLGWPDAAARVRPSKRSGVRRGDFGEALVCELLEVFDNYAVPIRKLRYQTDPEQTLHGTDIVGFGVGEDGGIQELHFLECKLSTVRALARGVEAHDQLAQDRAQGYADTLLFIGERLWETDRALFEKFEFYLAGRDREERGTYGIALVWDRDVWDDDTLIRINEVEDLLDPLYVRVLQTNKLRELVEAVYDAVELDVIDDGS